MCVCICNIMIISAHVSEQAKDLLGSVNELSRLAKEVAETAAAERIGKAADRGLNAKKQAALDRVLAAAAETEAKFTAPPPASAISRHAKGRTRKLAGGVSRKREWGTQASL